MLKEWKRSLHRIPHPESLIFHQEEKSRSLSAIYQSASVSGLWYPAKKPGDIIKVGEYLGCVKDYEGNILETSLSDLNGVVLYQAGSLQVIKDGPMVAYGSFSRRKDERKKKITNYWAKRSDSFM